MEEVERHTMAWLCIMIPDRLAVGPSLEGKLDAMYMHRVQKVTHIVNMKPLTDKTTSSGKANIANWFECYFHDQEDERGDEIDPPTFLRFPVPDPKGEGSLATMNQKNQIKFFIEMAKRVAKVLQDDPKAYVYIHNSSGCDEEAFVAFLTWLMVDKASFPPNVVAWMKQHYHERLLDSEEERATLAAAIQEVKSENVFLKNWLQAAKKTQ